VVFDKTTGTSSSTGTAKSLELNEASGSSQSTSIAKVVKQLSITPNLQPAGSLHLNRDKNKILKPSSDFVPQALISFIPRISNTLYPALSSVNLIEKPKLEGVYVLRLKTALLGYNAPPPKGQRPSGPN
jgi:hypothetical protein